MKAMNAMWIVIGTVLLTAAMQGPALAQDEEKELGWFFEAEFASVTTTGNSETRTFSLGSTLRRVWTKNELAFEGGGLRSQSTLLTRRAIGTSQDAFHPGNTGVRLSCPESILLDGVDCGKHSFIIF